MCVWGGGGRSCSSHVGQLSPEAVAHPGNPKTLPPLPPPGPPSSWRTCLSTGSVTLSARLRTGQYRHSTGGCHSSKSPLGEGGQWREGGGGRGDSSRQLGELPVWWQLLLPGGQVVEVVRDR